jgi:hypothetical protein
VKEDVTVPLELLNRLFARRNIIATQQGLPAQQIVKLVLQVIVALPGVWSPFNATLVNIVLQIQIQAWSHPQIVLLVSTRPRTPTTSQQNVFLVLPATIAVLLVCGITILHHCCVQQASTAQRVWSKRFHAKQAPSGVSLEQ